MISLYARVLHSFPTRRSSDLIFLIRARLKATRSRSPCQDSPRTVQGFDLISANEDTLALPVAMKTVDRKSTRLNSSHLVISYAVFCLKKKARCSTYSCLDE